MNGSRTSDFREAINHIHSKSPKSRLFSMGFSLGAGVLLKYLGEDGVKTPIEAAASISPPWDGERQSPFFPLWSVFLSVPVKLYALRHRSRLSDKLSLFSILIAGNLRQVRLIAVIAVIDVTEGGESVRGSECEIRRVVSELDTEEGR